MPTSYPAFDKEITTWIADHPADRYLDIGPGDGKYGVWIRALVPGAETEAIEIDPAWIDFYKLNTIYGAVTCADATTFFDDKPDYTTDIVFIGDAIEHMKKSAGLDLLHYLIYRCKWILLTFPCRYIQYAWYGHANEAHRSAWSADDFAHFDYTHLEREHDGQIDNLIIVKGWL